MSDDLREQLAAIEHQRWSDWQQYMHNLCVRETNPLLYGHSLVIPAELVARWERQIATPYAELTEAEKASDREQVDRYWPLIAELLAELLAELDQRDEVIADYSKVVGEMQQRLEQADAQIVELGEAQRDAEQMRLVLAVHGGGIDPEGFYAGSPGWRLRRLMAVVEAAKAWRAFIASVVAVDGTTMFIPENALIAAVDALGETQAWQPARPGQTPGGLVPEDDPPQPIGDQPEDENAATGVATSGPRSNEDGPSVAPSVDSVEPASTERQLPDAIAGCICSTTAHGTSGGWKYELNADADCPIHGEHPEARCRRCGTLNSNDWCAPSPLWNEVMRGGDIGGIYTFFTIKGKVSSNQSQMTTEDLIVRKCWSGGGCDNAVVGAPGDDGSYGPNEDGIFFFTTDGVLITWNGKYLLSDAPMKVNPANLVLTYVDGSKPTK